VEHFYFRFFAFAGIWDIWKDNGKDLVSCSIITTEPNDVVKKIHTRMPVILKNPLEYLGASTEEAVEMLTPYDAKTMKSYKVSDKINSPENDSPDVINSLDDQGLGAFM